MYKPKHIWLKIWTLGVTDLPFVQQKKNGSPKQCFLAGRLFVGFKCRNRLWTFAFLLLNTFLDTLGVFFFGCWDKNKKVFFLKVRRFESLTKFNCQLQFPLLKYPRVWWRCRFDPQTWSYSPLVAAPSGVAQECQGVMSLFSLLHQELAFRMWLPPVFSFDFLSKCSTSRQEVKWLKNSIVRNKWSF